MVNDLAVARFNRAEHVEGVKPLDTLHAALADEEVQAATHIFVIYGKLNDDGSVTSGWMQGGSMDSFAQTGLLARAQMRLWEGNN